MDKIQRDIYFLRDWVKYPIDYPQGSDKIPLVFTARDYDLPSGATTRVCVEKPSGKAIYNEVTGIISGNVITIQPQKQMTAEAGRTDLQVEINKGGQTLLTFVYPINVKRSLMRIDSENGSNFIDEYLRKMQECMDRMEETREEIIEMAERGDFSASIDVGDTATLEPGEPATVKNIGTIRDAILNFGIPKGKTGATGPRGPQGVQGIQGPPGEDGEDGGNGIVTELGPGLFGMYVNEGGHLIMVVTQGEEVPTLKIVDGRLKYILGEAGA